MFKPAKSDDKNELKLTLDEVKSVANPKILGKTSKRVVIIMKNPGVTDKGKEKVDKYIFKHIDKCVEFFYELNKAFLETENGQMMMGKMLAGQKDTD